MIPTKTIQLDFWRHPTDILHLVQGEADGRKIQFKITDNGSAADLTGFIAIFAIKKPDGNVVVNSATITEAELGIVETTISSQVVTTAGNAHAELHLMKEGQLSKSFRIVTKVAPGVDIDGIAPSVSEFNALQTLIGQAETVISIADTDLWPEVVANAQYFSDLAGAGRTVETVKANADEIAGHIADDENPHTVTLAQLGAAADADLADLAGAGRTTETVKGAADAVANITGAFTVEKDINNMFELGTLNVSTGTTGTSTTRARTNDFIPLMGNMADFSVNGAKINVWSYTSDKTYISNKGWGTKHTVTGIPYVKITIAYDDDRTITDLQELISKLTFNQFGIKEEYIPNNSIGAEQLKVKGVNVENTEFLKWAEKEIVTLEDYGFGHYDDAPSRIQYYAGALSYKFTVKPHETINIKASNNDRFQIGILNEADSRLPTEEFAIYLDDVIAKYFGDVKEYEYVNDEEPKTMFVYVRSSSGPTEASMELTSNAISFDGYVLSEISDASAISKENIMGERTSDVFPVMFGVKMTNERDFSKGYSTPPRPLGWLYYDPVTFKIYYANGEPGNLKYLCDWNKSITWNGASNPAQYRPFITKNNDIVFVWRGDLSTSNPRQNPIVYPSGDYDNPVEVDLGEGLKPTAWLQNCGADYIYNQDVFLFAEYTRPQHINAHVWRVSEPITDPSNWQTVHSVVLSGDMVSGIKHFHTMNYDTYSGMVYTTIGDDDSAAKILSSDDYGVTWTLVIEGQRKYARVLNFIFTKDKVYWANDDLSHGFYSVDRDINGVPDFTNITTLANLTGHPPTYVNVLIENPSGVLILNRHDVISDPSETLDVLFWSFEDSTLHTLASLSPLEERVIEGQNYPYGFRIEACNFYQARGDNRVAVGFASPANVIDILGNDGTEGNVSRINNMILQVIRKDVGYGINFSAIPAKY